MDSRFSDQQVNRPTMHAPPGGRGLRTHAHADERVQCGLDCSCFDSGWCSVSAVVGNPGHGVIGLREGFGEQAQHVPAREAIQSCAAVGALLNQSDHA